jgi:hypothetical protein
LHYDPETGDFRWLKRMGQWVRAGDLAGGVNQTHRYRNITINGINYTAHHLAWLYMTGNWCRSMIDHRDMNRANNSWSNLRRANRSTNNANRARQRNNSSGFKGVSLDRRTGRWRAQTAKNGRKLFLGSFATPQAAHAAYEAAARELFGEFARTE